MSHYTLDNSWSEADRRLGLLELYLDDGTKRRVKQLGHVGRGSHCLEIGAGRGSIVKWLSEIVGDTGTVTAIDINTNLIRSITSKNVRILQQDVTKEPIPVEEFDFVHARWTLCHISHREEVLEKIIRALRPGGLLLLEEIDFTSLISTQNSPYRKFFESIVKMLSRRGGDGNWARSLVERISKSEFNGVGFESNVQIIQGGSLLGEFWALTGQQLREELLDTGHISLEQFNEAVAALKTPNCFGFGGTEIASWGRKLP